MRSVDFQFSSEFLMTEKVLPLTDEVIMVDLNLFRFNVKFEVYTISYALFLRLSIWRVNN